MCSEIDPGLEEAITTILWVAPRLCADVQELKEVCIAVLYVHFYMCFMVIADLLVDVLLGDNFEWWGILLLFQTNIPVCCSY